MMMMMMMMMMTMMTMIGQGRKNLIEGKAKDCVQLGSSHKALTELESPDKAKLRCILHCTALQSRIPPHLLI